MSGREEAARRRHDLRALAKAGMDAVCERMGAGKPLPAIAASLGVDAEALLAFVKLPENAERYRAARAERAEALAEQALDIVDAADAGDVRIVKLRVDTRKWLAAHLDPGRYGESRSVQVGVNVDAAHLDLLKRMADEDEAE
jgi:hypothetical protein